MRSRWCSRAVLVGLAGCGAPSAPSAPSAPPPPSTVAAASAAPASPRPSTTASPSGRATAPRPDEAALFARLEPDLVRCYEAGRKSVPTMLDGRLTLTASIDAAGKIACALPTDTSGLTLDVAECMSERFAEKTFGDGSPTTVDVRIAVRSGRVELGTRARDDNSFESVETRRMPDAFDVLESLLPSLQECARQIERTSGARSLMVGARITTKGKPQCALASGSPVPLPAKDAECAANILRQATFPPPSGGPGLILVPIRLAPR